MVVFAAVLLLLHAFGQFAEIYVQTKKGNTAGVVGAALFFPMYLFVGLALLGVL